jgi:hypothetical protein
MRLVARMMPSLHPRAKPYFSELLIEVNWALMLVPSPLTTAMITSEIPAAIKPYSMAVAPLGSFKKRNNIRFKPTSSELSIQDGDDLMGSIYRQKLHAELTAWPQF